MKPILLMLAMTLLAGCQTMQRGGVGERPNILIMGEDAEPGTVPRNNRIFKRVLDALANEMNDEGFDVYDETAVTLDNFAQGRIRRTDGEIIDIARSIKRPPIDVAVIYGIYAHAQARGYTDKLDIRIAGRLLNVRSGRRLGNFEVELPEPISVSPNCGDECRQEAVGRNARVLARDLGAVLATRLDWLSPVHQDSKRSERAAPQSQRQLEQRRSGLVTAYALVFDGFTPGEMTEIEDRITAFAGFEHSRPVNTSLKINEYWYETSSAAAQLNRNLRHMLTALGLQGRVTYGGNQFKVEKIQSR